MAKRVREKAIARAEARKEARPFATAKYIRISPYKVRAVLDVIRGKSYIEARAILNALNKSSSDPILKVLDSAAANAEHNKHLNKDLLFVAECYADQGSHIKRMQPVSKGRGHAILKRTSHITVVLDAQTEGNK
ncbi:MAG: 50S ribosomal protein L22 [Christensenellaceae bacterium]|jgi:large subunit ribosomal protein L22|nr:50S ribosomal protein L22 [Christensenellaceae bacterium]